MCLNLSFEVKNKLTFYKVRWFKYTFCYLIYSMFYDFLRLCKCSFLNFSLPFHDGGCYHIEMSPLICGANLASIWLLYDNGLRHEESKWGKNEEKC